MSAQYAVSVVADGNPNVDPEKADTLTFGVVYQPSWLEGFAASIDAFDVKIARRHRAAGRADDRRSVPAGRDAALPATSSAAPDGKIGGDHQHVHQYGAGPGERRGLRVLVFAAGVLVRRR